MHCGELVATARHGHPMMQQGIMGRGTQERLSGTRVRLSFPGWNAPVTNRIAAEMPGWPRLGLSQETGQDQPTGQMWWAWPSEGISFTRFHAITGSTRLGLWCLVLHVVQTRSQTFPLGAAQDVFQTGNWLLPCGARDKMHRPGDNQPASVAQQSFTMNNLK